MLRILSGILLFLFISPVGRADWMYTRADGAKGALTLQKVRGTQMVALRHFCFALGCRVLYQWPQSRALIKNPHEQFSAIVSSLTHVVLVNGHILDSDGEIVSTSSEGYLLPLELARKLALTLALGHIDSTEPPEKLAKLSAPPERAIPKSAQSLDVVIIDPGHGGSDLGTSFQSIYEKDLSLLYALKLREDLHAAMPDLQIYLTREDDRYVSLPDRAKVANAKGANLFLSLHVNHASEENISGVETYILSPDATDAEARKVALLENESWMKTASIKEAGDNVKKILVDMEQTNYIQHSALAAAMIQQELSKLNTDLGLRNRGVKQAMFYVLSQVAMPSVLVEMGFLSSTGDRGRLMNVVFRDQFVKSIVSSLKRYREKLVLKPTLGG